MTIINKITQAATIIATIGADTPARSAIISDLRDAAIRAQQVREQQLDQAAAEHGEMFAEFHAPADANDLLKEIESCTKRLVAYFLAEYGLLPSQIAAAAEPIHLSEIAETASLLLQRAKSVD